MFFTISLLSMLFSSELHARVPVNSQAWFYTGVTSDAKPCRVEFYWQDSNRRFEVGISVSSGNLPYGDGWFESIQLDAPVSCEFTERSHRLTEEYRSLRTDGTMSEVVLEYRNSDRTDLSAVILHSADQCTRLENREYSRELSCVELRNVEL